MGLKIRTETLTYFTAAVVLLLFPAKIWMAALLAVCVHELSHLVSVWITGGKVIQLRFGICGARILMMPMSQGREVLCALAGPLGSFSLLALGEYYPEAAVFGLIQGVYNLLPVYPLDGGRIMRAVFSNAVCSAAEGFTVVMLWGSGLFLITRFQLGLFPLFPAFSITAAIIRRKYPCKEGEFAVQ